MYTANTGGDETRPMNKAVRYFIRATPQSVNGMMVDSTRGFLPCLHGVCPDKVLLSCKGQIRGLLSDSGWNGNGTWFGNGVGFDLSCRADKCRSPLPDPRPTLTVSQGSERVLGAVYADRQSGVLIAGIVSRCTEQAITVSGSAARALPFAMEPFSALIYPDVSMPIY